MAEMAKLAYLVKPGEFEFREYPVPEIDDDQILIRVEGCGVCGTDGHEYKRDPFGLCPVVLGHEGSGEIIKLGRNVKTVPHARIRLPARISANTAAFTGFSPTTIFT